MPFTGQQIDTVVRRVVAKVNIWHTNRNQALNEEIELMSSTTHESPTDEQVTQIRSLVSYQLEFPPNPLTEADLDENTFSAHTIPVDGSWFDEIEDFPHGDRLREHLDLQGNLTDGAKDALEITARHILRYTPNPELDEFVWRGLVVGNVQSGKTATFTSLIARAFDVGYHTIIILSGRLESLRKQTAQRLHQEISLTAPQGRPVLHYTQHYDDFRYLPNDPIYMQARDLITTNRTIWVSKKEARTLDNLNRFLHQVGEDNPEFRDHPVLIIDDETDEAGVDIGQDSFDEEEHSVFPDVNNEGEDPQQRMLSRVNTELRRLISKPESTTISWVNSQTGETEALPCANFSRVTYVGFTATPYACCFQELNDPDDDSVIGRDLYPRDFILVLDDPPNYCGGELFVGRSDVVVSNEDQTEVELQLPSFLPPGSILQEYLKIQFARNVGMRLLVKA